jgi:fibronectin type 3 domain-containing protein
MHNLGAVHGGAPHSDGGGHCTEEHDIMCTSAVTTPCPTPARFDCNHDDYFYAGSPPSTAKYEYIRTHWNTGNSAFLIGALLRPGAPEDVSATPGPGAGQIQLTWKTPAYAGSKPIEGYRVYGGDSPGSLTMIAELSSLAHTESLLPAGKTRYYRVSAFSSIGETSSDEVSATTYPTPSAPQALTGTWASDQVTLTWSQPTSDGGSALTAYHVYRSTNGALPQVKLGTTGASSTSFTDTSVSAPDEYFYTVRAESSAGEGPDSNYVQCGYDPTHVAGFGHC